MASYNWPPGGSGGGGGMVNGAANVGTGVGVFQVLSGSTLNFRSVTNGTGLTWVQNANDIQGTVSLSPFSTTDLAEGTNLYFTQARARLSISGTAPVAYDNTTGVISMHVADATHDGYLSQTDWSTFNSKQAALTFGNLTDVGTDGITVTGGTGAVIGSGTSISQHVADATHNGYLSQTDWSTFNGKQNALSFGNLTDVGTDGITVTGGTGAVIGSGTSISQHVADATHNGYLSSTDWNSFTNATQLYNPGSTTGLVDGTNGLKGFANNSTATAGYLAEEIVSNIPVGSAISLTTATATNIGSLSLTAGSWRVTGSIFFHASGLNVVNVQTSISSTSATLQGNNGELNGLIVYPGELFAGSLTGATCPCPENVIYLSGATTIYLVGLANFPSGSVDAFGWIRAVRLR